MSERKSSKGGKGRRPAARPHTSSSEGTRGKKKAGSGQEKPFEKFRKEMPVKRKHSDSPAESNKPSRRKSSPHTRPPRKSSSTDTKGIRLNKYIANAGVCSRRDADQLIISGVVKVNGVVVTELGTRIQEGDEVSYGGQKLSNETPRYVLLNKPKDYLTTTDDPGNRKTVMALVHTACRERIYPVGRLDRHTTGLLLFTNDGQLAKKLMHPSHRIKKLYHVTLDKNLSAQDMKRISEGLILDDGPAPVDGISYVGEKKNEAGVEIHIGRNRIVRRIFEHLGYRVTKLDRVMLGTLTKKDLPRGRYRHLTEKEVSFLKML